MRVVLIGCGRHGRVVGEMISCLDNLELAGIIDPSGKTLPGIPNLGGDEVLVTLKQKGIQGAVIGLGGVRDSVPRERIYERIQDAGLELVNVIHPSAYIAPSAQLGTGITVMPKAVINTNSTLHDCVIINSAAVVEHDCTLGAFSNVAPNATLGGNVKLGHGVHIGLGASVRDSIQIASRVVVGAGAVVVKDITEACIVAGVPAKPLKTNNNRRQNENA